MMKSPSLDSFQSIRQLVLVCICTLALYGCSGDAQSSGVSVADSLSVSDGTSEGSSDDVSDITGMNSVTAETSGDTQSAAGETTSSQSTPADNTQSSTQTPTQTPGPSSSATTRVNFDITVPAYMSDELQVRLTWGEINTTAAWVRDESWAISETLPVDTENPLVVIFADRNGSITLGSVENTFRTGMGDSENVQITADQFDIERWDSDNDGVANLSELIAGTNPDGNDVPLSVEASLELVSVKTFRFSWQSASNAGFYRILENPDGISGFTNISGDLDASTTSYDHVVALFSRTNAQYIVQSCEEQVCTDSNTLLVSGTLDEAVGYLKASNTDADDLFGVSVSLSADGNTLAVGAQREASTVVGPNADQNNNEGFYVGAAYVFARINGVWQQQAYLKADRHTGRDRFGDALSLSDNGNVLVVGASGIDNETGEAYIFTRSGGVWQRTASLTASNGSGADIFGNAVAISADGETVAVGAFGERGSSAGINGDEQDNSFWRAGAVYVFVETSGTWQQQAYIKQSNPDSITDPFEPSDSFGRDAISLSADGNTLAVGASGEDSAATGINGDGDDNSLELSGAVYVYVRTDETWLQQAYVKASNPGVRDFFGSSVSLSADGNVMAVGADGVDDLTHESIYTGAVYMFNRVNDIWQQQTIVQGDNIEGSVFFGADVSLSSDGNTLAVGASGESGGATGINGDNSNASAFSGAGYVFKLNDGVWRQTAYVKAINNEESDHFGASVSLSGDGNTLAIGATGEDSADTGVNADVTDNTADTAGAVYLY